MTDLKALKTNLQQPVTRDDTPLNTGLLVKQELSFKENLTHLFKLLDDESPEIRKILREEISNHSLEIVLNKDLYMQSLNEEDAVKFNRALEPLHRELILNSFSQILNSPMDEIDLEKSMLLLSYWSRSKISCLKLKSLLDGLAGEVSVDMPHSGHPLSFIDHINQVLFQKYHFRGNSQDYYNPGNSFLHKIFETGLGIPISLSIIYMLVSRRLNFPVFGVCMPAHFILKFDNGEDEIFFDPFHGGKIYSRQACLDFMQELNVESSEEILQGCTNLDIIKRVLRNLHLNYSSHTPDPQKVMEINEILALLESYD